VEPSASRACWPPGRYQAPVWTPPDASTKSIVSRFDPEVSRGTNGEPSVLAFASARHRSGNRPMRRPSRSCHASIRRFHVEPSVSRACWPPGRNQAPVWTPPEASTESIVSRFDPEVSRGTIYKSSVLATRSVPGTGLETGRCVERVDRVMVRSRGFTWNLSVSNGAADHHSSRRRPAKNTPRSS